MITVSTEKYQAAHGKKPRGSRRWVFEGEGVPTRVRSKRLRVTLTGTLETDGPWAQAHERALAFGREVWGERAEVTLTLRPY